MEAEIRIWSSVGHTPVTKRAGKYCDLLVYKIIEVANVSEAKERTKQLIRSTQHATKGNFYCPEEPNQNKRTGWVSLG